jgi:hypothetical protein
VIYLESLLIRRLTGNGILMNTIFRTSSADSGVADAAAVAGVVETDPDSGVADAAAAAGVVETDSAANAVP